MMVDLCGVESIQAAILASPVFAWRITESKPVFSESGYLKSTSIFDGTNVDNKEEASKRFGDWAEMILSGNPNNNKVYYLTLADNNTNEIGRKKRIEPITFSFSLVSPYINNPNPYTRSGFSFPAGGKKDNSFEAPQELSQDSGKNYALMLELEKLRWENEMLRQSIIGDDINIDDDMEEDEEEEEKENIFESFFSGVVNSPPEEQTNVQRQFSSIIEGLASKLTGINNNPELDALKQIKAAAPDADKLIIKLGEIAKNNPEQMKEFVSSLLITFNTQSSTESST